MKLQILALLLQKVLASFLIIEGAFDVKSKEMLVTMLFPRRSLPFGASKDPVRLLSLHVTWPDQHESLVTEDDLRSDLDPDEAPLWSVSVSFEDQGRHSVLSLMFHT